MRFIIGMLIGLSAGYAVGLYLSRQAEIEPQATEQRQQRRSYI